jgi:hypothetical protein
MFNLNWGFGSSYRNFQEWWVLFFEPNYIQADYIEGE